MKQKIQWVLFSATYPEEVIEAINKFVTEASQIKLSNGLTDYDHIKQFVMQCRPNGKADFLVDIFKLLTGTQLIIFVNTKDSALSLKAILKRI